MRKYTRPACWLVTTEVSAHGGNMRSTHVVYARSERAATGEAREREAQAWGHNPIVSIVSVSQA